jgi:hypothetical protein
MDVRRRRYVCDFKFWTVPNFPDAQLCTGVRNSWVCVRSLCIEYTWLCARHPSVVSGYASELFRNRTRTCPSTDAPPSYYAWTTHLSHSFHWHPVTITSKTWKFCEVCVFGRTPSVIRASDVRGILHCICLHASTCAICQWFVSDCKWYVRGSCMIRQWFLPPALLKIGQFLDAQTQSVRDLWVILAWSAVRLALMLSDVTVLSIFFLSLLTLYMHCSMSQFWFVLLPLVVTFEYPYHTVYNPTYGGAECDHRGTEFETCFTR